MFGGSGKRPCVRSQVTLAERTASGVLLGLIAAIATAVFWKGQVYDPGLFALDASRLTATAETGKPTDEGRAPTLGAAAEGPAVALPDAAPELAAESAVALLADLAPQGWQRIGEVEHFSADDLYVKIDGRAEQYLAYDVVGLVCAGFGGPDGRFVDVYIYDMGDPVNAFGIYSAEKPPEPVPVDLGAQGYRVAASCFFFKGHHYVQVIGSASDAALQTVATDLAYAVAARIPAGQVSLWGLEALPAAGRVAGSLQYFKRNALSLEFLPQTFTAQYLYAGSEVTAFVSRPGSTAAAAAALAGYLEYLQSYGELLGQRDIAGATLHTGDLGGLYDAVFQLGPLVGGVSMAPTAEAAEAVGSAILQHNRSR